MKDFRDLKVWQRAHCLVLEVYRYTEQFPRHEAYGLRSQVRRAAASIPANLAEGCGRGTDGDFGRFVQVAMGSASELEYHVLLCRELGFFEADVEALLQERVVEVKRMLAGLLASLRA